MTKDEKRNDNISKLITIAGYVKKCDNTKCRECILTEDCAALLEALDLFAEKLKLNNGTAN